MAVFPSDVTVTAVDAMTYFTPAETKIILIYFDVPTKRLKQVINEGWIDGQTWTFVIDGVVVELSWSVFRSQTVPQREVIDGEQVVFINWSQELPVKWKFNLTKLNISQILNRPAADC